MIKHRISPLEKKVKVLTTYIGQIFANQIGHQNQNKDIVNKELKLNQINVSTSLLGMEKMEEDEGGGGREDEEKEENEEEEIEEEELTSETGSDSEDEAEKEKDAIELKEEGKAYEPPNPESVDQNQQQAQVPQQ